MPKKLVEISHESPTSTQWIILVHGTFAGSEDVEGIRWWQRGSDFHAFLCQAVPWATCQPVSNIFTWNGENSERERRRAGARLARMLSQLEETGQPYHLVGHSHGGSVVWHALTELHQRSNLEQLRSVVTVGTPFFRYGFDHNVLWNLLPLGVAFGSLLVLAPLLYSVYNENWWQLRHAAEPALQFVVPPLILIIGSVAIGTATSLIRAVQAIGTERSFQGRQKSCFAQVSGRYVALFSRFDEAINGLATTLGFRGPILRRSEHAKRSPWNMLELFRRVYDRCIAQAGDDFIWRQLSRRTQGNDIHGLRLSAVARFPVQVLRDSIIGANIETELANTADEQARTTLSKIRMLLDVSAARGLAARDLLKLVSDSSGGQELIHTIYFNNAGVRQLVASHIERCRGSAPSVVADGKLPGAGTGDNRLHRGEVLSLLTSGVLAATVSLAAWVGWTLALPYTTAELMRQSVEGAPFLAATFETHEETCEFLRLSVFRGFDAKVRQFVQRIELPDDKMLAHVCMSRGYRQSGDAQRANEELRAAQAVPDSSRQGAVPIGPPRLVSFSYLALLKEYGYLGQVAEAANLLPAEKDNDPEHIKIRATGYLAIVQGLVEAGKPGVALPLLTAIPLSGERLEALDQILRVDRQPRETLSFVRNAFRGFERSEALAKVIHDIASTPGQGDPEPILQEIEEASSRANALRDVVKAFGRARAPQAEELIRSEMVSFERRPRLVGGYKKLSYIYFADAFRMTGNRDQAEKLLRFASTLPKERDRQGDVWDDISGPEIVRLKTRMGKPEDALPLALAQPDTTGRDDLIRDAILVPGLNFPWLRRSLSAIIDAIPDRSERLKLRIIDAETNEGTGALDRYESLAKETDLVNDAKKRSELLSSIAQLMIFRREYRRAISYAKACRPADQLRAINALLLIQAPNTAYNLSDWLQFLFRRKPSFSGVPASSGTELPKQSGSPRQRGPSSSAQ